MNKWLEIIIGIILLVDILAIFITNFLTFGKDALTFLLGGIIWIIILIGIALLVFGLTKKD